MVIFLIPQWMDPHFATIMSGLLISLVIHGCVDAEFPLVLDTCPILWSLLRKFPRSFMWLCFGPHVQWVFIPLLIDLGLIWVACQSLCYSNDFPSILFPFMVITIEGFNCYDYLYKLKIHIWYKCYKLINRTRVLFNPQYGDPDRNFGWIFAQKVIV